MDFHRGNPGEVGGSVGSPSSIKFKFSLAVVPVTVPGPAIIILPGNSSICLQIRCIDSESRYVNH